MLQNGITVNAVSWRSNSNESLERYERKKERKGEKEGEKERERERRKKKTFDCAAYVHKGITRKRKRKNNLREQ